MELERTLGSDSNLLFNVVNGISRLYFESNGLSSEGLDENLHVCVLRLANGILFR